MQCGGRRGARRERLCPAVVAIGEQFLFGERRVARKDSCVASFYGLHGTAARGKHKSHPVRKFFGRDAGAADGLACRGGRQMDKTVERAHEGVGHEFSFVKVPDDARVRCAKVGKMRPADGRKRGRPVYHGFAERVAGRARAAHRAHAGYNNPLPHDKPAPVERMSA